MTQKALEIAKSQPADKDTVLKELTVWIEAHLVVDNS
jgi:hypothetical protein